jgi:GNAT superfamily N-acetyltransferase
MSQYQMLERDFESFFQVPFEVYRGTPFVSMFKPDLKRFLSERENPLYAKDGAFTFYTILRDNVPVGRIVAHIHYAANVRHNMNASFFGFFDCDQDPEVARKLLEKAAEWGRAKGCTEMIGNMNLTAMQQMGVTMEHFERLPYSDHIYSPPHIAEHLKKNGFTPFFPMTTFEVDIPNFDPQKLLVGRPGDLQKSSKIHIRTAPRWNLKRYMEDARAVLNAGFDKNPFFVPVTQAEFAFQAQDLMWVIDPELTVLAYENGKPVGVVICIPDLNPLLKASGSRLTFATLFHYFKFRANRRRAVIIFYSVNPDLHGQGLAGLMLYHVTSALKRKKYETLGITWIADENIGSLRQTERLEAKPLHKLNLFKKAIA